MPFGEGCTGTTMCMCNVSHLTIRFIFSTLVCFTFPSVCYCNTQKVQIYFVTNTFTFALVDVQEVDTQPLSVKLTGLLFL